MIPLRRDEILLLFDIDGTLTPTRSTINPIFEDFLYSQIKPRATIGIVTGAELHTIFKQLNGPKILSEFDYVFPENGTVQIERGIEVGRQSIQTQVCEDVLQRFINYSLRYMSDLVLPFKRGSFLEFRSGMLNISPIGRNYSRAEREKFVEYNKAHRVIPKMISALQMEFKNELQFSMGGQTSFDIYPPGWDKTYCLPHVTKDTNFKQIHFFGDKTELGENDHDIFNDRRTIGHKVASPRDTQKILSEIFELDLHFVPEKYISELNLRDVSARDAFII